MPTTKKITKKGGTSTTKTASIASKTARVKVAVKKAPAKKTTTKKSAKVASPAVGCACIVTCAPEQAFWINRGPVVDSIAQLKEALRTMTEDQFAYHTRREGNDFARWVRECLADAERAARLERATTKAAAVKALSGVCCK